MANAGWVTEMLDLFYTFSTLQMLNSTDFYKVGTNTVLLVKIRELGFGNLYPSLMIYQFSTLEYKL